MLIFFSHLPPQKKTFRGALFNWCRHLLDPNLESPGLFRMSGNELTVYPTVSAKQVDVFPEAQ